MLTRFYSTTVTEPKHETEFKRKNIPHIPPSRATYGMFFVDFGEIGPRYNGTTSYFEGNYRDALRCIVLNDLARVAKVNQY